MSHATSIREWALQWPHAPMPSKAWRAADAAGVGLEQWPGAPCDEWLVTYWLIVAEAMEGEKAK